MVGRDAPEFALIGVRSDSAEERADLPFPTLEVGPQDRNLVAVIGNFDRGEPLCAATQEQAALPLGTQVSDPLSVPAWRHEIAAALQSQNIDRGAPRLERSVRLVLSSWNAEWPGRFPAGNLVRGVVLSNRSCLRREAFVVLG